MDEHKVDPSAAAPSVIFSPTSASTAAPATSSPTSNSRGQEAAALEDLARRVFLRFARVPSALIAAPTTAAASAAASTAAAPAAGATVADHAIAPDPAPTPAPRGPTMDLAALERVFAELGALTLTPAELADALGELDTDGSGHVEEEEWVAFMTKYVYRRHRGLLQTKLRKLAARAQQVFSLEAAAAAEAAASAVAPGSHSHNTHTTTTAPTTTTAHNSTLAADSTASASTTSGVAGLMKHLDRLQGEQVSLARKIELEKRRRERLDAAMLDARATLRAYQDATKGGSIVKDEEQLTRKLTGKLEHSLQQARAKLSATHKDNAQMKRRVDETRQDKIMHLTILHNVEKDLHEGRAKIRVQQKEIIEVNERKHRLDVDIANLKGRMFAEMEVFSGELVSARANISHTQTGILDSIRERLTSTFNNLDLSEYETTERVAPTVSKPDTSAQDRRQQLAALLLEVGAPSLEALIVTLQQSEEEVFARYNGIQDRTREAERLDLDNRHTEAAVEAETKELEGMESASLQKQQDLEVLIASIRKSIDQHEAQYAGSEEMLGLIKGHLLRLFRAVAVDEEAQDQQILSTGVNERNIPDFLGTVEQRIDDLIQMLKAAHHEAIRREDFGKAAKSLAGGGRGGRGEAGGGGAGGGGGYISLLSQHLPSVADEGEEEEEEGGRVQPVSVSVLKDFMNKKVQRGLNKMAIEQALNKAAAGRPSPALQPRASAGAALREPQNAIASANASANDGAKSGQHSPHGRRGSSSGGGNGAGAAKSKTATTAGTHTTTTTTTNAAPPEGRRPSLVKTTHSAPTSPAQASASASGSSAVAAAVPLSPTPPSSAQRRSAQRLSRELIDTLKSKPPSQ